MDISIIIACSRIDKIKLILEGFSKQETEYCYEVIVVGCEINISNENYNYLIKVINCNQTHPNIKRNIGIDHATSKIIGFMDDDAIPERNWVDTAVKSLSRKNIVITGPEKPYSISTISKNIYEVCCLKISEGTSAHVNKFNEEINWADVPFCNCVFDINIIDKFGKLDENIPWDMDDFHFFYKIRNEITFLNVKELKIFHDRYPDNYNKFFKYKYKNRFRTGEKVITHPGIYLKIPIIYILFLLPAILIYLIIYYKLKTILLIIITLTIGYFTFLSIYFLNNDIKKIVNFTEFIKIIVGLHSTIFIGFYNGFIYKIFFKLFKLLKII